MKKLIHYPMFTPLVLASSLLVLTACSSNDDDEIVSSDTNTADTTDTENSNTENTNPPFASSESIDYGYVFTRGPNFESGQIERISLTDGNIVDGTYTATGSDHAVATDGESVYQIGRFTIDNLTKFSATDTSVTEYQISVLGDEPLTSNPQALAFVDDNLAYLTRRNSDTILIIDPTPEEATPESLITGEITLASYNQGSGETLDFPDMTSAVIVDDKLFVLLENLDGFAPVNRGYLAVISTSTNLEIDTGEGEFPRQGIELQTVNPTALHYNDSTGLLYVAGRGNSFGNTTVTGDPYTGGIESIDPTTYQTTLLLDDGTQDDNNGFFTDAVVISNTLGYAITLDGFTPDFRSISNLRSFNPTTGEISEPIQGTAGQNLTNLAVGLDNHLWVGIQADTSGFIRIDLETGEPAAEIVATNLIPSSLVFINVER